MSLRLLIDECLSLDLVDLAIRAGHVESTCLRNRGLLEIKDWRLMKYALAEDFTLVTMNARDFRGRGQNTPGGLYASVELHAGLVCLNFARRIRSNCFILKEYLLDYEGAKSRHEWLVSSIYHMMI